MSRATLTIELRGGLLIGGGDAGVLNDATVRRKGAPFIPAAAIKGAVREQLVRLAGEGKAVELLGCFDAAETEGTTRVRFSDGVLVEGGAHPFSPDGYAARAQVSIDRRARRAAHERLFHREIVAPRRGGITFAAPVELAPLEDGARRLLNAAVRAVFAIGGGRSGGLGAVSMTLETDPPVDGDHRQEEIPEAPTLDLVLEAVDPICLGDRPFSAVTGNFHVSLGHIPASTLRGALVTAALAARGEHRDLRGEAWFKALAIDPQTCLRFGDAAPLDEASSDRRPCPAAFSLRTCKAHGEAHGWFDTLVRAHLLLALAERGHFEAFDDHCPVAGCGARAVPFTRRWLGAGEPLRRVVTRLALDRATARGQDGQLFSIEVLEPGSRFVARIDRVDAEGRKLIADAARHSLRVGHGRGQGYGRMRIVQVAAAHDAPLADRLAAWRQACDETWAQAVALDGHDQAPDRPTRQLVSATLTSDLIPSQSAPRTGEEALLAALSLPGARLLHADVRAGQRGGFASLEGQPKPYLPVIRAGSALLLELAAEPGDAELARLEALEAGGAGERREEGYGGLRFCDHVHLPGWRQAQP